MCLLGKPIARAILGAAHGGGEPIVGDQRCDRLELLDRILLVEAGIPIMEVLDLTALAASGAHEFLFIAAPLKIKGGTGSPVRPLAVLP